ncbi:VWA domain-containing protein [Robiginitalea sp. M366]|uniref:vWA domain-containing protein n=1 Tax=Robiginitalea aestuariiviva TaxID=3036903 RepID=UPI00240DD9F3|nr:vWA domain-containing protein [Robiginitalea aestuariiviva]MDG1570982.1 VWA domain-containing protein [Robiginitalea aestuariiviva]
MIRSLTLALMLTLGGQVLFPATAPHAEAPESSKIQIALLLDTSNSMDGLINQAKATLWDLVNEFTYVRCGTDRTPRLEIALYEYGNDNLSAGEGYIRQVLPFSNDLDEVSAKLFSLQTRGGEEYCGQVIGTAMQQLQWSRKAEDLKMVFIAGNEPFNQGRTPYPSVLEQARERDVVVNTIFCGDYQLGIRTLWADGAHLGGGQYTAIDHNQAIVHVPTPYDEVIIRLNRGLNQTYIGYGSRGAEKKRAQAVQDVNAMEMEEGVMVARAVSKSSGYYQNSSWDLVDAYAQEKVDLERLEADQLPDSLRHLQPKALKALLEKQLSQRQQIQEAIRQANADREAFLKAQGGEKSPTLQQALLEAVKKQAGAKNFHWIR